MPINQKGVAHLFLIITLLVGLVAGVYLVQHPAIFKPKADEQLQALDPASLNNPALNVSNQIIVKYKDGQSPEQLKDKQDDIKRRNNSAYGRMVNRASEARDRLLGEKNVDEKIQDLSNAEKRIGFRRRKKLFNAANTNNLKNIEVVEASGAAVSRMVNEYKALSEVEYVQSNHIHKLSLAPNDGFYSYQWNMKRVGMEQAWDLPEGNPSVLVGVIDSGIDYNNPDLIGKVVRGRNFTSEGPGDDPMDLQGHGTFVAGIIGASVNNSYGVAGVNKNIQMIAIKVFDNSGVAYDDTIAQAVQYAADSNVKIINYSGGAYLGNGVCQSNNPLYQDAVNYAASKGVLFVQSAGNDNQDIAHHTSACSNIFSVAATTVNDTRAPYSNYGAIDIAAPGGDYSCSSCSITSLYTDRRIIGLTGTSFSAPLVSGAAALLLAQKPNLSAGEIRNIIVQNADPISPDRPIGKRLNIIRALSSILPPPPSPSPSPTQPEPSSPPSAPQNLNVTANTCNPSGHTVSLAWYQVSGALGYNVYRKYDFQGDFSWIGNVPSPQNTFTDTNGSGIIANSVAEYKAIAGNAKGQSDYSNSATAPSCPYGNPGPNISPSPLPTPTATPTPTPQPSIDTSSGPVGYWNFNEGTGPTALNNGSAGGVLNANLSLTGGQGYPGWTDSFMGKGINLDGIGDYLYIWDNPALEFGSSDFTIAGWYFPTTTDYGPNLGAAFYAKDSGRAVFSPIDIVFRNGDGGNIHIWATTAAESWNLLNDVNLGGGNELSINNWHHIAFIRRGGKCYLYIDSKVTPQSQSGISCSGNLLDNNEVSFIGGAFQDKDGYRGMAGTIEDYGIWKRALSQSELSSLWNNGSGKQIQ